MNRKIILAALVLLLSFHHAKAQYPYGDHWYDNPLGFKPLKLHTVMAFLAPAAATGVCLLVTKNDTTLVQRLSVYQEIGPSWGYKYPYAFVMQSNTGINYQLRKFLSVGVELNVTLPHDDFNSPVGFAVRPFARFYPVNREKWKLYFESGGGLIFFTQEFPQPTDQDDRLGTFVNGFTKYGIGSEIKLADAWGMMVGVRHIHVSNGDTKGVERNPSHDSNGFFVGVTYQVKKKR